MSALSVPTRRATAVGVLAVLLWSCLAVLTTLARGIGPFEILSLSFAVAFILGMIVLAISGRLGELKQHAAPWISSFCGIFFFHLFYFFALGWAPPAQASLIVYLWPLFIVLLSAFSEANNPRALATCVLGGLFGFAGTALTLTGNGFSELRWAYWPGYLMAFASACVWSGYSVFNRRFGSTPSGMLVGVCGAVSAAGFVLHSLTEHWVTPTLDQSLAIVALGAGPTGLAFFFWDYATKRGHLGQLGILSYLAPLLSVTLLMIAGEASPTPTFIAAAILIASGALIPKVVTFISPVRSPTEAE